MAESAEQCGAKADGYYLGLPQGSAGRLYQAAALGRAIYRHQHGHFPTWAFYRTGLAFLRTVLTSNPTQASMEIIHANRNARFAGLTPDNWSLVKGPSEMCCGLLTIRIRASHRARDADWHTLEPCRRLE